MANFALTLKREGVAQAWNLWITSATGEAPIMERHENGIDIKWNPGQAVKMEQYLNGAMTAPSSPDDLNVSVDLKPVLIPLVIKKTVGWLTLYSALLVFGTKFLWKK